MTLALALTGALAAISGCGSSGAGETATTTGQAVKFSQCMRRNGISQFPDPGPSGDLTIDGVANGSSIDPNGAAFKQALAACRSLQPAGFMGTTRTPQQARAAIQFAQCIRADGVPDFPDPLPNGPLVDTNRIPSAAALGARNDPALQAAMSKCGAIYGGELGLRGR